MPTTFKNQHPEMQHLAKELVHLATRNKAVLQAHSGELQLYSFLAVQFLTLERFLRISLGLKVSQGRVLRNLLELASSQDGWISLEERTTLIKHVDEKRCWEMHRRGGVWGEFDDDPWNQLEFAYWLLDLLDRLVLTVDTSTGAKTRSTLQPSSLPTIPRKNISILSPDEDLRLLRSHNMTFQEGDDQATLLLFAEGVLGVTLVEGACRGLLPVGAQPNKFSQVLKKLDPRYLVGLPGATDLARVKNSIAHGDFERAANYHGTNLVGYFKSEFAREVERMYKVYACLSEHLQREQVP